MEATWSLQDAKNRFSAVVDAAERGEPQLVTKRGRPAVVVVRADEFARLRAQEAADDRAFVDHLLAIPRCYLDLERMELEPRQVTFNGESAG
jgi:prevent-host-death family protein